MQKSILGLHKKPWIEIDKIYLIKRQLKQLSYLSSRNNSGKNIFLENVVQSKTSFTESKMLVVYCESGSAVSSYILLKYKSAIRSVSYFSVKLIYVFVFFMAKSAFFFGGGGFGPSSVHRGRTHTVLG